MTRCRGRGGIGIHKRLKISRAHAHAGSSPAVRTILYFEASAVRDTQVRVPTIRDLFSVGDQVNRWSQIYPKQIL